MSVYTAADALLDILRDEGVTRIFGNPGSTEMALMDRLVDVDDIAYVLALQEASAVGMADGYALATGRPAFVNLHTAGGLGNAMGVLFASKASETPLVVTAGQQDTRHLFSEPWLSGDLVGMAQSVTKWAAEVRRGGDVAPALRRAFAIARTPPQGPVFLSLPMDVLEETVGRDLPLRSAAPARAAGGGCAAFAGRLAGHDPARVAVLIGDDAPSDAAAGVQALAHAGGYPVHGTQVTSRVAYASDDPCWAGMLRPDFAAIRGALGEVEAIVLVGGRAFVAYPYRAERPIPEACRVYHVAAAPEAIGREFPAEAAVVGDIGLSLAEIARELAARTDPAAALRRVAGLGETKRLRDLGLRTAILASAGEQPTPPDAAALIVMDALPAGVPIVSDSAVTFGAVQSVMRTAPGEYFFARGGVLGCAMPAAVGVALGRGGPVACFCGDGGAMYSPQAMWSAAQQRAQVLFFVFNNARYNVLMNVARGLGAPNALAGRFVGMNIDRPRIDFQALARTMGVTAARATSPEAIRAAIDEGLARGGPTLIEIPIS
ncbi:MAG: thiamine pyrophosphate-binding protein [Methylobacteriaceae bacterium]|nr:thiamine pyrophosphate-binding protein [Methylobacteriaceae bacterium]